MDEIICSTIIPEDRKPGGHRKRKWRAWGRGFSRWVGEDHSRWVRAERGCRAALGSGSQPGAGCPTHLLQGPGPKGPGVHARHKSVQAKEAVPPLVVPELAGISSSPARTTAAGRHRRPMTFWEQQHLLSRRTGRQDVGP